MSKLNQEELIGILRRAGRLPGLKGWHKETVEQIVALIQKPGVTEEWYEEKAKEILKLIGYKIHGEYLNVHIGEAKDFIRSLVEEIPGKKMTVSEEFIKKWADIIHQADTGLFGIKGELKLVRQMFKEAGISVA